MKLRVKYSINDETFTALVSSLDFVKQSVSFIHKGNVLYTLPLQSITLQYCVPFQDKNGNDLFIGDSVRVGHLLGRLEYINASFVLSFNKNNDVYIRIPDLYVEDNRMLAVELYEDELY